MILDSYDNEIYVNPYWGGNTIYHEPITFIKNGNGDVKASLLFEPEEIFSFRASTLDIEYKKGKDFIVNGKEIILTPDSNIPFIEYNRLFCDEKTFPNRNGDRYYKYLGGGEIALKQVAVSYKHSEKWDGYVPQYAGDFLPYVCKKLKNKEKLHITFVGDSITANGDISSISKIKPFMPRYPDMTVSALKRITGADITFDNFAIGGTVSEDFFKNEKVLNNAVNSHPDLLVIAYGMNDGTSVPVNTFKENIQKIFLKVKECNPECECIAISTIIPNTDACWVNHIPVFNFQDKYENALDELEKIGFAVARMTSVYKYLEEKKSFYSLTANGINHPNDFTVRAYAQTLISMLIPD